MFRGTRVLSVLLERSRSTQQQMDKRCSKQQQQQAPLTQPFCLTRCCLSVTLHQVLLFIEAVCQHMNATKAKRGRDSEYEYGYTQRHIQSQASSAHHLLSSPSQAAPVVAATDCASRLGTCADWSDQIRSAVRTRVSMCVRNGRVFQMAVVAECVVQHCSTLLSLPLPLPSSASAPTPLLLCFFSFASCPHLHTPILPSSLREAIATKAACGGMASI